MNYAYLVIADKNGVRKVPIGYISQDSKVIGMEFGQPTISTITRPAESYELPLPMTRALIMVALSLLAWQLGGAWALTAFALTFAALTRIGSIAWKIAQQRQQAAKPPLEGASSKSCVT